MVDVFLRMLKDEQGNFIYKECIGGITIRDKVPDINCFAWTAYKIYPITPNIVLFQYDEKREFVVQNGVYEHPHAGKIEIEMMGDYMNIVVTEKKKANE